MSRVEIKTEEEFKTLLLKFIDILENQEQLDQDLYTHLLSYGINKDEFDKMIESVKVFASYDDDNKYMGFPYEIWYERLLQYYSEADIKNVQAINRIRKRSK